MPLISILCNVIEQLMENRSWNENERLISKERERERERRRKYSEEKADRVTTKRTANPRVCQAKGLVVGQAVTGE